MAAYISYPCSWCHPSEYSGNCLSIRDQWYSYCAHTLHTTGENCQLYLFTLQLSLVLHVSLLLFFTTESNAVSFWSIYISVIGKLTLAQVTVSYESFVLNN